MLAVDLLELLYINMLFTNHVTAKHKFYCSITKTTTCVMGVDSAFLHTLCVFL